MFRILIPVDFAESTTKACHYALRLASAAPEAEILLLHCFKDYLADPWVEPTGEGRGPATGSEEVTERVMHRNQLEEQNKLEALREDLQSLLSSPNVHLKAALIEGLPEDVIPEEAKRFRPHLLLMGTEGENSLARSVFGTITTKMLDDIKVPVLTVPQHAHNNSLTRVLYATDFDEADTQAILDLLQLLQPFNPHILCLHISSGSSDQKDKEKLAQLQANLEQHNATGNLSFRLLEGKDVAETLHSFIEQEHVDLLAVTNRKRSLLDSILHPSLTKKLVLQAEVPLLVFHNNV
jgi:nucleotide-binding universal stress UspA family protein